MGRSHRAPIAVSPVQGDRFSPAGHSEPASALASSPESPGTGFSKGARTDAARRSDNRARRGCAEGGSNIGGAARGGAGQTEAGGAEGEAGTREAAREGRDENHAASGCGAEEG